MTEHPILFSGAMVRANLREVNPKTQTRRVAKFIPLEAGLNLNAASLSVGDYFTGKPEHGKVLYSMGGSCWQQRTKPLLCPYGNPGDRLWVRETWAKPEPGVMSRDHDGSVIYAADYPPNTGTGFGPWRPSIHMPRWASRLTLEITKVRVERVQQITPDDCIAEGVEYPVAPSGTPGKVSPLINISDRNLTPHLMKIKGKYTHENLLIAHYAGLWDSINAKRDSGQYAWEKNPWVWVIEYKRLEASR